MSIVWNHKIITGHPGIDGQHKMLFGIFNDFMDSMVNHGGQEEVGKTLTFLSVYISAHFQLEESLMVQTEYEGLSAHCAAHQTIKLHVEEMVDQFKHGGVHPVALGNLLEWWLVDHVLEDDKALARFLIAAQEAAL